MMQVQKKDNENPTVKSIFIDILKHEYTQLIVNMKKKMGVKMARDIKNWRIEDPDKMYSWRTISSMFVQKYPEFSESCDIVSENELSGILLCDAAMIKLKEKDWK